MIEPGDKEGFTLGETVVTLAILAILITVTVALIPNVLDYRRDEQARAQLLTIKRAIIGESREVARGQTQINQFGYVGDMGKIPSSLNDLFLQNSQPAFQIDADSQVGHGWRGPYVQAAFVSDLTTDPWGNALIYDPAPFTDPLTGARVEARLRSKGPDGIESSADDLTVDIYRTETFADIIGFIKDPTSALLPKVSVSLKHPSNGVVTTISVQTSNDGLYSFDSVPLGVRSISLDPKIVYKANTAFTSGPEKDKVEFIVTNLSKNPVTVSSLTPVYESSPQAYFKKVFINGVKVFDSDNPRGSSGTLISFSAATLSGTGVIQEAFQVVIHREEMHLPDFTVGTLGAGGELQIRLEDFKDQPTGASNPVDMTGVVFEITFSDGSVVLFAPRRGDK
ncbi:MAG: hypothetical protein ACRD1R_06005 [Acidobacteriota bacterium]